MLKIFLWLRYLRKKKIVSLSVIAVALSVALLVVVSSLFNGFIDAFEKSAVHTMGDVVIFPPVKVPQYPSLIEHFEKAGVVKAATATLSGQGLLFLSKGNVRGVTILGIDPVSRARVTGLKQSLLKQSKSTTEPSFEIPGMDEKVSGFVSVGVVGQPDEKTDEYDFETIERMIGKTVTLTTGAVLTVRENDSTKTRIKRKVLPFTVADIVFTGVYELDKTLIYLPIDELQKKLYPDTKEPIADKIQIKLADDVDAELALAQIRGLWEDFAQKQLGWGKYLINLTHIYTSQQLQSQYIAELRKQMAMLLLIFGIISLSVILLISCILYMIVITKQKDIAIIKSCGATSGSVAFIFVGFGGCVGIIGSVIGVALGWLVTKNINVIEEWIRMVFGLKLWKSSVYMFSAIPNQIDWESAMPIVLFAIAAAAIGALVPAIVAAKTRPVNILRYE